MALDGDFFDRGLGTDQFVGLALREEPEDVLLAGRELTSGNPRSYDLEPVAPFGHGQTCAWTA